MNTHFEIANRPAGARALPAADRSRPLALSFGQERLWFLDEVSADSGAYNVPHAYRLHGPFDHLAMQRGLNLLAARHEILRTAFAPGRDGLPEQRIAAALELVVAEDDLSSVPAHEREVQLERLLRAETAKPFNLAREPLLRARSIRLAPEEHVFILVLPHILTDDWSSAIIERELSVLYAAALEGADPELPDLPLQYADYAAWEREWLTPERLERQLAFWRSQLADVEPLPLPASRRGPSTPTFAGASVEARLPAALRDGLFGLARTERTTPFVILLAAVHALLARHAGAKRIAVGAPTAGRPRREFEGLIGFFVNMLVFRGDVSGDPTFRELLARTRATAVAAYSHRDIPFQRVVAELRTERELGRNPVFQVGLTVDAVTRGALELPQIVATPILVRTPTALFDLEFEFRVEEDDLVAAVVYNSDRFDEETAEQLVAHLTNILTAVASDPDTPIGRLPIVGDERPLLARSGGHARPDTTAPETESAPVEAATGAAAAVAASWQAALGVASLAPDDNFFELGGRSLLAVQVTADLKEQLGRRVPLLMLFDNPTFSEFAAAVVGLVEPS